MEVVSLLTYNKYFRDFDSWPFNRVWPLNGGLLNRGSTVVTIAKYTKINYTVCSIYLNWEGSKAKSKHL